MGDRTNLIASFEVDSLFPTDITFTLSYENGRYKINYRSSYNSNIKGNVRNQDDIYVVYNYQAPEIQRRNAVSGGTPEAPTTRPDLKSPTVEKSSVNNPDGTNTITLSVKGDQGTVETQTKADVIVVLDLSGSMKFGFDKGKKGYWYDEYSKSYYDYKCSYDRFDAAKSAVKSLSDGLLGDGNNVRMSLITFNDYATLAQEFTSDKDDFNGAVDNIKKADAEGGTNWEDALNLANSVQIDSSASTYVIFVSDGDPTFRITKNPPNNETTAPDDKNKTTINNTIYRIYGTGNSDPDSRNYNAAMVDAKSIVNNNKTLYTIGVSTDTTRMSDLCSGAYSANNKSAEGFDFQATSKEGQNSLSQIFDTIKTKISSTTYGFSGVKITDGITSLTNLVAKDAKAKNDSNYANGIFKYYITDEKGTREWTGSHPEASYNSETGAVEWDLGNDFLLDKDVIYSVKFAVWPSQVAYDHVAKLKNGEEKYGSELKSQIVKNGDEYELKTNTDNFVGTYKESFKAGDSNVTPGKKDINAEATKYLENMPLQCAKVKVQKTWVDRWTQVEPDHDRGLVNLTLSGGPTDKKIELDSLNKYTKENIYIPVGLYVEPNQKDNNYALINEYAEKAHGVLEAGYEYSLDENTVPSGYDFTVDEKSGLENKFRPMVDGSTTQKNDIIDMAKTGSDGKYVTWNDVDACIVGKNTADSHVIKILKIDGAKTTKPYTTLAGAVFEIYDHYDNNNYTTPSTDINGKSIGTLTTDKDGYAVRQIGDTTTKELNLQTGTYYLKEVTAPEGYNKLADGALTMEVSKDGVTITQSGVAREKDETDAVVINSAGTKLPDTGGSGTLPFTAAGAILLITAGAWFALKVEKRQAL